MRFDEDKYLSKKKQAQSNIKKAIANNFITEISKPLLVKLGETWQLGRHKLTCCKSSILN